MAAQTPGMAIMVVFIHVSMPTTPHLIHVPTTMNQQCHQTKSLKLPATITTTTTIIKAAGLGISPRPPSPKLKKAF